MIMSSGVRKFALAAHLTVSIGWIGAVAAYIALDVTVASGPGLQTLRASYASMETIVRNVIVPLAIASLASGVLMSLGTKWGLFRHYWVLISLTLTVIATVVLIMETSTIAHYADVAAPLSMTASELDALGVGNTLVHSVGGTLVLLVILVLNLYKPQGLTPYGWRKQQAGRAPS